MNFQHLRHFVVVAEERHFGRAAERIGMAQPPLSQSIRRLEDSLGRQLFSRTKRRVELTAAGEALLDHAREILNQVEYARKAVNRASEAGITRLTVGYTPNALSAAIPAIIREIRRSIPAIDISLREGRMGDHVASLMDGTADVGLFHTPAGEIRGLELRLVSRSRLIAAIPEGWPLARRESVGLADLEKQPLILFPCDESPELHALLVDAFVKSGQGAPRITEEASNDVSRLQLVAAQLGISLVTEISARAGHGGVVFRPIHDVLEGGHVDMVMGWRRTAPVALQRLFQSAYLATQPGLKPVPAAA